MITPDVETKRSPSWDLKTERCKVLSQRYPYAREILDFYQKILTFQKGVYEEIKGNKYIRRDRPLGQPRRLCLRHDLSVSDRAEALSLQLKEAIETLLPHSASLLSIARGGPPPLAVMAREVSSWGLAEWLAVLEENPQFNHKGQPLSFFPRVLLQPYMQWVLEVEKDQKYRSDNLDKKEYIGQMGTRCPFCGHKPQVGYLLPADNASQRFLVCSFCHGEWPYRRLSCPGCAESDKTRLSYFVAEGCPTVRLDACDSCGKYIKTVDLGKDPEAIPVVDELATLPLDLWARERGYEKLELNLAGI